MYHAKSRLKPQCGARFTRPFMYGRKEITQSGELPLEKNGQASHTVFLYEKNEHIRAIRKDPCCAKSRATSVRLYRCKSEGKNAFSLLMIDYLFFVTFLMALSKLSSLIRGPKIHPVDVLDRPTARNVDEPTLAFFGVSYSIPSGCMRKAKTILKPLRYVYTFIKTF